MASRSGRQSDGLSGDYFAGASLVSLARQTQQARIICSQHFPKNVFRDAAWDIVLELFIVAEEGRRMCVKDAMVISGDSATGTMRRLEGLEEAGLVRRRYDPYDNRRVLVELSAKGRMAMVSLLHHLFEVGDAASKGDQIVKPVSFVPLYPHRRDGLRDCS